MTEAKPKLSEAQDKVLTQIIEQMSITNDNWEMPWHRATLGGCPINLSTGTPYRGFNRLILMIKQSQKGYITSIWGTFSQWRKRKSFVQSGEKATTLFYPVIRRNKSGLESISAFRVFWVFNGDQVTNFNPKHPDLFRTNETDLAIPNIAKLTNSHQVKISFGDSQAFYRPSTDSIHMPSRKNFIGSKTSTADEAFYSTLLHEMVHWTGHKSRLDRFRYGSFGDNAYAFEELVAELGAAFLCSVFKISNKPRLDHAQYLNSWLNVLNEDKSKLWKAASKAQEAVDFISQAQDENKQAHQKNNRSFSLESQPTQKDFFE